MASESKAVVWAALAGNVAVAATKYVAAVLSGSSAMLTEAVHSTADTANQITLLIGNRRGAKPADAQHPFGYDGEIYFWTFVVAVMVLIAGGVASIAQGVHQLRHPEPVQSLRLSLLVLGVSALFEGSTLFIGWRASRRIVASHPGDGRPVSTWKFIKVSKDPNLYETLLEDSAALIGIAFAAVGVVGSAAFGLLWMDGAASIAIGLLLIADSYVIAYATRSLIAGEAIAPALQVELEGALRDAGFADESRAIRTLHVGPNTILVFVGLAAVHAGDEKRTERLRSAIHAVDERLGQVFFGLR